MKKLLIVFLLFIFSVQGTVAAAGVHVVSSLQGQEDVCDIASCLDSDDADGQQVSSDIEELSDYAVFHFPISRPPHLVALATFPALIHLSPVLPRIKPPPRLLA
ncbi:hypothetical protein [Noviherbaspirillum sp.]|uniref:hypothetical protein n=1 Tax=Noviherbaspirillum sp. TaxID=1926288 RepID=UPI002D3B9468|nr:hypothetical protein [Noviherbaspirillum sp.]HZW23481.1 hypothetical protein [Noviherbaspirillum sp.]